MKITQKVTTFLWFDNQAEEAMKFYVNVFNNAPNSKKKSKVISILRYKKGMETPQMPKMTGQVLTGVFELEGQKFMCLDGGPIFQLNESMSLFIECKDQREIDYFFKKLSAEPKSEICGWLKDKFGVSWQVIPTRLMELTHDKNPQRAARVINAMLTMKKINIAELESAV